MHRTFEPLPQPWWSEMVMQNHQGVRRAGLALPGTLYANHSNSVKHLRSVSDSNGDDHVCDHLLLPCSLVKSLHLAAFGKLLRSLPSQEAVKTEPGPPGGARNASPPSQYLVRNAYQQYEAFAQRLELKRR